MATHTREQFVFLAKLAEQAERYDGKDWDMIYKWYLTCIIAYILCTQSFNRSFKLNTEIVSNMKHVASMGTELSVEERNLLSVGYKTLSVFVVPLAHRHLHRAKEESRGNSDNVKLIREYRAKVEEELASICEDILKVLDEIWFQLHQLLILKFSIWRCKEII